MVITTYETEQATGQQDGRLTVCQEAAHRLYDAEVALHIARETQVDEWIAAAYDRLHLAVTAHLAAAAELAHRSS